MSISFWMDTCGDDLTPKSPVCGDLGVDVAIVGAGYTGLWTAYYLAVADPALRIAVLEAEIAGFGASGRNGGWCSALFPVSKAQLARRHGRDAAIAMQRAMNATVGEVGTVAAAEGIDAHWAQGGTAVLATAPSQVPRLRAWVEDERSWGFDEVAWLSAGDAPVRAAGLRGAAYTPHCAAIDPGRLARGLARAVERRGVRIFERTRVESVAPGVAVTAAGRVRAEVVVRAVEGYTPLLAGHRRTLVPLYSLVIATEPLPAAFWDGVGWRGRETVSDGRHLIIYAQRTADDRIVFGGRGAPYHFGRASTRRSTASRRCSPSWRGCCAGCFPAWAR